MRKETLEAGVKPTRFETITVKEYAKFPEIVEDFLQRINKHIFVDLLNVRGLITPNMWAVQKMIQAYDLTEYQLLRKIQYQLRVIWMRPSKDFLSKLTYGVDNPLPYEFLKAHAKHLKDGISSTVQKQN